MESKPDKKESISISWFPEGVDNALCINGQKIIEGPGAGGRATALRMFKDFEELPLQEGKQHSILVGYGNVGKEIEKVLFEHGRNINVLVRSTGVYVDGKRVGDVKDFTSYLKNNSTVFISVPSAGEGKDSLHYYVESLVRDAHIITCEKAVLANHWELVKSHPGYIRYSATVGGNSGILPAIDEYPGEIREIRAVVNGTLGYISTELARGRSKEEIYAEVTERGYAEPGSQNFEEVVRNELRDVALKAVLLANHSGLYKKTITLKDVEVVGYRDGRRCVVLLNKKGIKAGFL